MIQTVYKMCFVYLSDNNLLRAVKFAQISSNVKLRKKCGMYNTQILIYKKNATSFLSQKKSIFFYIQQQFGLNFVPTKINCLIKRSVFFEIEKLILLKNFILNKT